MIRKQLAEWLRLPEGRLTAGRVPKRAAEADGVFKAGSTTFVVKYKGHSGAASVTHAVEQAKQYAQACGKGAVPIVAVAFMGEVGRGICEQAGVSWMDLSGNASIVAPGVRILVEGKPNRFKRRGRPSSVFAPKSSRVARQLLIDPGKHYTQRELATATRLGEGFISRIVRRMEADGQIVRRKDGSVTVADPKLLLDEWHAAYDFSKHTILKGHIAARSSDEVIQRTRELLNKRKVEHALTGLAAAWAQTGFAGFRLVTMYLAERMWAEDLAEGGFRDEERGANLWLVVPNDEGVFDGHALHQGVPCVHPVQVYLDLKAQPERSAEAAEELRKRLMSWSTA
ncbi:MAG: type IV toxin-antitoxin system AbiEi family antitoxin [Myxococcota bacterium]